MKTIYLALAAAAAFGATTAQADTVVYNGAPADTWYYGDGNDYIPANTAVLTTDAGNQLSLRWHKTFETAPASTGNVYNFTLGTDPLSFDWGIDAGDDSGDLTGVTALLTLTNLGSNASFSYDPFGPGNDNYLQSGSAQNSARLNWFPVGFNPNVDGSYRVTLAVNGLAGGPKSLSVDAILGAGAPPVPEPATWAMMIAGFGMVGGSMRRRHSMKVTFA